MTTNDSPTVVAAFVTVTAADATRPLITFYDDATGERTELSAATLANWVAKTANLLVDGLGLGPGDIATLALPPHWQTAAIMLGCWSAGLAIRLPAIAPEPGELPGDALEPAAVGFAAADRLDQIDAGRGASSRRGRIEVGDLYALALDPLAMGFRPGPPPGTLDFNVEVRGHGDHFNPAHPVTADTRALASGETHGDVVAAGLARGVPAATISASPGKSTSAGRVLIDAGQRPNPLDWLVAPLLTHTSVVLCRHLDESKVDSRLAAERAQRW